MYVYRNIPAPTRPNIWPKIGWRNFESNFSLFFAIFRGREVSRKVHTCLGNVFETGGSTYLPPRLWRDGVLKALPVRATSFLSYLLYLPTFLPLVGPEIRLWRKPPPPLGLSRTSQNLTGTFPKPAAAFQDLPGSAPEFLEPPKALCNLLQRSPAPGLGPCPPWNPPRNLSLLKYAPYKR